jgi:hypothetical protein
MIWGGSGAVGLKTAQFKQIEMAHSNAIKLNKPGRLDRLPEVRE